MTQNEKSVLNNIEILSEDVAVAITRINARMIITEGAYSKIRCDHPSSRANGYLESAIRELSLALAELTKDRQYFLTIERKDKNAGDEG